MHRFSVQHCFVGLGVYLGITGGSLLLVGDFHLASSFFLCSRLRWASVFSLAGTIFLTLAGTGFFLKFYYSRFAAKVKAPYYLFPVGYAIIFIHR